MSVESSSGIQTLLEVEKESQKIVQKARECRAQGLKNARSEAQTVIEEYRAQKEEEFERYKKELAGFNLKEEEHHNKVLNEKLENIRRQAASKKEETIKKIIEIFTKGSMEIHPNASLQICRELSIKNKVQEPT
ncbi:V-type ATPase, G subunit [Pneumocystis carinii B80]|uniref:V-type proton ATPase subunit G n=1 Tax=Pneumocystis carinii (strain B80) TaxID=1408658 RepID=A0A0W4ZCL2_PNEC8|nr:V-type ATPase, G subunit [Pneumocystis carinii B80]KTW25998.1 V-type ATPase, G subunit [Pneumocystis carinii B80]